MSRVEVGSLFAGIGGFDLAAEQAGMRVAWQSEIDRYSSRVLEHRWPQVPNLGDINDIRSPRWVDILCGGFPCQDYSVAGHREGLAGDRGALWWEYHRLIDRIRPTWVVGENVPGLLSSRGGRDFETIVRSLTEVGYGVVWAVLDSQYFGVAQRRRRLFIVGHSGGIPRPEVLALAEGMFGHPEPSRESEQEVAASLETRPTPDRLRAERGHIVGFSPGATDPVTLDNRVPTISGRHGDQGAVVYAPDTAGALRARDHKGPAMDIEQPNVVVHAPEVAHTLRENSRNNSDPVTEAKQHVYVAKTANTKSNGLGISGPGIDDKEVSHTLDSSGPHAVVSFSQNQRGEVRQAEVAPALAQGGGKPGQGYPAIFDEEDIAIRKLTPLECERLQGFPDGWTDIPKNSDTQRYKQLGNAVTVNTVEWIFRNIAATYDDLYLVPATGVEPVTIGA